MNKTFEYILIINAIIIFLILIALLIYFNYFKKKVEKKNTLTPAII